MQVSAGARHLALLTANGVVMTCGKGTSGQLGFNPANPAASTATSTNLKTAVFVPTAIESFIRKGTCL